MIWEKSDLNRLIAPIIKLVNQLLSLNLFLNWRASIVVFNYLYLLDPKVSEFLKKELKKDSVVFDEAHNIDDVCIEAYTVRLNKPILLEATNNIEKIAKSI